MKTKRILAASTAALLSMATVAVVASAADATVTEVSVAADSFTANAKTATATVAADADSLTVKITGVTGTAVANDAGSGKIKCDESDAAVANGTLSGTVDISGIESTGTVTFTYAEYDESGSDWDTDQVLTITVTRAAAEEEGDGDGDGEEESPAPSAAKDILDVDTEDGTSIGNGVTIKLTEKDLEKYEDKDFNMTTSVVSVVADDGKVDVATTNVVKDLSKSLKNEIKKIDASEFKIIDIGLADGSYVETTAPTAIQVTVVVPFDAKVYHVNGENVEKLKVTSRKLTGDAGYEVSFSTKNFSPFIFTTADLKNAKATTATNDPTDSTVSEAGEDGANPSTGIALAIAPVVLAAGAVAVVALKKKH